MYLPTSVNMELVTPGSVPTLVNTSTLHQACSGNWINQSGWREVIVLKEFLLLTPLSSLPPLGFFPLFCPWPLEARVGVSAAVRELWLALCAVEAHCSEPFFAVLSLLLGFCKRLMFHLSVLRGRLHCDFWWGEPQEEVQCGTDLLSLCLSVNV